ncbi:hypothetical protein ACWEQ8_07260 [Streptomyces noursei]
MTITQDHAASTAANPRGLVTDEEFTGIVATVLDNRRIQPETRRRLHPTV